MNEIITMQDIKNGKMKEVQWKRESFRKDGTSYPDKVWENLECVLKKHNIKLRYNLITKELESEPPSTSRTDLLEEVYTLNVIDSLNMSREECIHCMNYISHKNSYNPFVEVIQEHENSNYGIIHELFKCIIINDDNLENQDYYFTLFTKWCLNLVKMSMNTLKKKDRANGILVLQGLQGTRKTTFVEKLMPIDNIYNGDKTLNPDKTDSVIENTKYILVEWGELDSTLKGEQSKLKQFITGYKDEYRSPYGRFSEAYPRLTTFIGTVNDAEFLKDATGSRRFWVIPVKGFDFDKLESIDKKELWGAVYSLWKGGTITDYLEEDEMEKLNIINRGYNYKNDVSYIIEEKINWDMPKDQWEVYGLVEIAEYLFINEKKSLKIELEKMGLRYGAHRNSAGKTKRGFKIPRFEIRMS